MRISQQQRIFNLLKAHANRWVPLTTILDLRIAGYRTRISELRKQGHTIENKITMVQGIKHSWTRMVTQ